MSTPAYENILNRAVTVLQTITNVNGYTNDISAEAVTRRVVSLDYAIEQGYPFPYMLVIRGAGRETRSDEEGMRFPKAYKTKLPIMIICYVQTDQSTAAIPDTTVNALLNDIQRAFVAEFPQLQQVGVVDISFAEGPEVSHGWDPEGIVYSEVIFTVFATYFLPFEGY